MNERTRVRVALYGQVDLAGSWLCAAEHLGELRPVPDTLSKELDAIIVAPGTADPFARTKEALQAGLHVLYAAPFLLSPWQASALNELSNRQKRLLRFTEPFQYRPGFSFLQRLLKGSEPLWQPLYLRMLRLAEPGGAGRIDELATEELALVEALLAETPRTVTAAAGRRDEAGDVCAVVLILQYGDGPLVQCTISLAEATEKKQLVAVTPNRTLIMNDEPPTASLKIVAEDGEHDLAARETELAAGEGTGTSERYPVDVSMEETRRFLDAVAARDLSAGNGERWLRVASLWWAARQSLTFDGPAAVPFLTETEPPPLRVIQGGGKSSRAAGRRPTLTVVAR